MNLNSEQFEEMLAAYALDALDDDERVAFETELAAAPEYRAELRAYAEMLAGFAALAPAVAEPAGHRERMMAKLTPAPAGASLAEAAAASVPLPAARPPRLVPHPTRPAQPGIIERIAGWFTRSGRPALVLATASLVLAIGLILWNLSLQADVSSYQQQVGIYSNELASVAQERNQLNGQVSQLQQQLQTANTERGTALKELSQLQAAVDLLGQPSTVVKPLAGNNNLAFSQLIANDQQKQGVLLVYNLQPVASNQTYEFWLVDKQGNPIPAGLFNVDENGKGVLKVTMPQNVPMRNLAAGAVTIEPAGGLPKPSGKMVVVGNF